MMRGYFARNGTSAGLPFSHEPNRSLCRAMCRVIANAADIFRKQNVARDDDILGDRRPTGNPKLGRNAPFVDRRTSRHGMLFAVLRDEQVEWPRIFEDAAHYLGA